MHFISEQAESGCVTPSKPTHGDHFLLYEDGDTATRVRYLCFKPYKLRGVSQRICLSNGTWSGTAPTCTRGMTDIILELSFYVCLVFHGNSEVILIFVQFDDALSLRFLVRSR